MKQVLNVDRFNSTTQYQLLKTLKNKAFENILGKGENASNQYFLLFPQCFLPYQRQRSPVICKCFQFGPVQILSFGKELTRGP